MLALLVGIGVLAAGAWRAAAWTHSSGALRALAAITIAATVVVVESLAFGLVGLGADRLVLLLGVVAFAAGAHRLVSTSDRASANPVSTGPEPERGARALRGALAGGGVACLGWALWRPFVGYDGMLQNLVQINGWIHSGRPGSQRRVLTVAPVEAFPMTNDIISSWFAALTRSFAATSLWAVGVAAVAAIAIATVLAECGVRSTVRWLAVASIVTIPHFVAQLNSPKTDVAALAWLAVCGAMALAARRHPRLLPLAYIAGGLSIGSKTTTLPLVGIIVLASFWRLRPPVAHVFAGLVGATGVGGVWYVRNLLEHGSPLWPFVATPWGDPVAAVFDVPESRFVADPVETLRTQFGDWSGVAAGGLVLVVVVGFLALIPRLQRVRTIGLVGVVSIVLWTLSPVTGLDNAPLADDVLTSTTRYLLPTMLLGALGSALLAEARPRARIAVQVLLGTVVLMNLVVLATETTDVIAPVGLLLAACAGGAVVAGAARSDHPRRVVPAVAMASVSLLLVAFVGWAADGWTERHRSALRLGGSAIDELLESAEHRDGSTTVSATNVIWSDLAGDELQHDVVLLEGDLACDDYRALVRTGWLVLAEGSFVGAPDLPLERGCLRGLRPFATDGDFVVFAPTG